MVRHELAENGLACKSRAGSQPGWREGIAWKGKLLPAVGWHARRALRLFCVTGEQQGQHGWVVKAALLRAWAGLVSFCQGEAPVGISQLLVKRQVGPGLCRAFCSSCRWPSSCLRWYR